MQIYKLKIAELRKEVKLSQAQFGEAIGVTQGVISKWERGIQIPNAEYIFKIAHTFDVSSDYLIGLKEY